MPNSFSIDSAATMNLSINLSDYKGTPSTSPQQRKMSEIPPAENLLNATNFGRLSSSSAGGSSCKLYKKFEELMDLSSPYNHYRCLSPSESNLTQCNDGKYGVHRLDNKPGSSRLLRRQFSLDKDDCQTTTTTSASTSTISTTSQVKSSLDVPFAADPNRQSPSPTNIKPGRLHKQTSASVAQDLEKIEEIPISPTSSAYNHHPHHHHHLYQHHKNDLSQIPGSASGSPAQKKQADAEENSNCVRLVIEGEPEANFVPSEAHTKERCSDNLNNNSNSNSNVASAGDSESGGNREISLNVQSLFLR